ncbi:uncharacterized protein LOC125226947 [Leguminivora glycinivorella]|uniref:uncharacterized protein LOC125226947 n=1 Tax=Leguminivora glycinivorella TaxID=1035111 RepID=UPI00200C883B|nr:uncharacterized protein LOC125226947 [Leguminivora glycinivorella]
MHFKLLADFGNEFRVNTYIYEFLSNEYRPSIIEFHYKICDAFDNPKFNVFKPIYQQYVNASSCPFPKGEYNFMNISVPNMPLLKTFPLRKGRMFTTVLHREDRVVEGYIDIVIKQRFL